MDSQFFRKYINIMESAELGVDKQELAGQIGSAIQQAAKEMSKSKYYKNDINDILDIARTFMSQGYDAGWSNFLLDTEPREQLLSILSMTLPKSAKRAVAQLGTGENDYTEFMESEQLGVDKQQLASQIGSAIQHAAKEMSKSKYYKNDINDIANIARTFMSQGYDAGWSNFLLDTEPREQVLSILNMVLSKSAKRAIAQLGTGENDYTEFFE
jgi:hypothetical protein